MLNARIRKRWLRGQPIALIGEAADLSYPHQHLGAGPQTLGDRLGGTFAETLKNAERPMIFVGRRR